MDGDDAVSAEVGSGREKTTKTALQRAPKAVSAGQKRLRSSTRMARKGVQCRGAAHLPRGPPGEVRSPAQLSLTSSSTLLHCRCHAMTRLSGGPRPPASHARHPRHSATACRRRGPAGSTSTPSTGCWWSRSQTMPSTSSQRPSCRASTTIPTVLNRSRASTRDSEHHRATFRTQPSDHLRRGITSAGKTLNVLQPDTFGPRPLQRNRGTRISTSTPFSSTTHRRYTPETSGAPPAAAQRTQLNLADHGKHLTHAHPRKP